MIHYRSNLLLAILLVLGIASPTLAQSTRGQSSADVDLVARLKEVEGNSRLSESLLVVGQKAAAVCANCHGEGGHSVKPDIPNLAAQNAAYLVDQLQQFAQGRRRNAFMEGMIKALKADEKIGLVLYYSRQAAPLQKTSADAALLLRGKDIYSKNCFRCHAANGHGSEKFARIAGQQNAYVSMTLKRYRSATGERADPLMVANTKLMSDADIDAAAAYVASMN